VLNPSICNQLKPLRNGNYLLVFLPIEQVFAKAIIDEVKPADPYQPDGFLPIGNFIASCNFTQNRFSFMIESFSGFMKIRSKEVASQQIYSTNCLNSGLLFGDAIAGLLVK
jgi:hypothetical protein